MEPLIRLFVRAAAGAAGLVALLLLSVGFVLGDAALLALGGVATFIALAAGAQLRRTPPSAMPVLVTAAVGVLAAHPLLDRSLILATNTVFVIVTGTALLLLKRGRGQQVFIWSMGGVGVFEVIRDVAIPMVAGEGGVGRLRDPGTVGDPNGGHRGVLRAFGRNP